MKLQIVKLGLIDYMEAFELQDQLLSLRQGNKIKDTLLLLEHPPVLTIGRSGSRKNIILSERELEEKGVSIYDINRGGDITYHGPGQVVGYPIMDLNNHGRDIRQFVRSIEEVFIKLLNEIYMIDAHRDMEHTGVWVNDEKITAIGIAVKRWVTQHGFAFNVNTHLDHFEWIVPCGIVDKGVTSVEKITGKKHDMDNMFDQVGDYFSRVFNMDGVIVNLEDII